MNSPGISLHNKAIGDSIPYVHKELDTTCAAMVATDMVLGPTVWETTATVPTDCVWVRLRTRNMRLPAALAPASATPPNRGSYLDAPPFVFYDSVRRTSWFNR